MSCLLKSVTEIVLYGFFVLKGTGDGERRGRPSGGKEANASR